MNIGSKTALLTTLAGAGLATMATAQSTAPPNIMIILAEDMGPQLGHPALVHWGGAGVETPRLNSIAERGVLFPHAHITTPVCSASRTGILTSLANHTNRIRGNTQNYFRPMTKEESDAITDPTYRQASVPEQYDTLIEILKENGYHTGVTQKLHSSPNHKFPYDHWLQPVNGASVETVVTNARAEGKPFMIMYGPSNAHAPFTRTVAGNLDEGAMEVPHTMPSTAASRNMWARYLTEIQTVDSIVGQGLDKLEELDAMDNTIIVFLGDHGTGVPGAKTTPYDLGTRTPLMFMGGENIGIRADVVSDAMISTVDIMPTLLDFIGIEAPDYIHGHSYKDYLTVGDGSMARDYVVSEVFGANIGEANMRERTVTDGEYRLIFRRQINDRRAFNIDMFKVGYGGDPTNGDAYREVVENREADPDTFTWLARMHNTRFKTHPPVFEMYHTGEDIWETTDVIEEPSLRATRNRLYTALRLWAIETNDPDTPLQQGSAAETINDPFDAIQVMNEDDANHPQNTYVKYTMRTGFLDPDPDWKTRIFGNGGADFDFTQNRLDAPPGPAPLATHETLRLMDNQDFTVSVKTQFAGAGVGSGVAFGVEDADNYYAFHLLDGNTEVGGIDKDLRLVRVSGGATQQLLFENALPNVARNTWYTLSVSYDHATQQVELVVMDASDLEYYRNTVRLPEPLPNYSLFGISAFSSNNSLFDDFRVATTDATHVLGDLDNNGVLDVDDLALLRAAFGQDANENARFNFALPDDVIDEADAAFWMDVIYPAVTGERFRGGTAWRM